MTLIADNVEHWLRRAGELRATASAMADPEYDKMADRAVQRGHHRPDSG